MARLSSGFLAIGLVFGGCSGEGLDPEAQRAATTNTAALGGVTVVSNQNVTQTWGQSTWSASTIQVTGVQAGDAIVTLGLYWVSSGTSAKPVDQGGQLVAAVNQIATGYNPPVAAQIYYEFNASTTAAHVVTPPNLAYGGDGIFYVLLVRGLAGTLVTTGKNHATGTALTSISTQLAANALAGDFVVAIGGEDDQVGYGPNAGMSGPPSGWASIGAQQDADLNVPSSAFYRIVGTTGTQPVTWTWNDTTANVTTAAIAAFR